MTSRIPRFARAAAPIPPPANSFDDDDDDDWVAVQYDYDDDYDDGQYVWCYVPAEDVVDEEEDEDVSWQKPSPSGPVAAFDSLDVLRCLCAEYVWELQTWSDDCYEYEELTSDDDYYQYDELTMDDYYLYAEPTPDAIYHYAERTPDAYYQYAELLTLDDYYQYAEPTPDAYYQYVEWTPGADESYPPYSREYSCWAGWPHGGPDLTRAMLMEVEVADSDSTTTLGDWIVPDEADLEIMEWVMAAAQPPVEIDASEFDIWGVELNPP